MRNTNMRFIGKLLGALSVLGTFSGGGSPVAAVMDKPQLIKGVGDGEAAMLPNAQAVLGDLTKLTSNNANWGGMVLTEDGILLAENAGAVYATTQAKIDKDGKLVAELKKIEGTADLKNFSPLLNAKLTKKLRDLAGTAKIPQKGNEILTKGALGKTHWIDKDLYIRDKDGKYLSGQGLTEANLAWTTDVNQANMKLSREVVNVLWNLGIYNPSTGAFELRNVKTLHVDSEGYLKNKKEDYCDFLGNKVQESQKIHVDELASNGVTSKDFPTTEQAWSKLTAAEINQAKKDGLGDKVVVTRTYKCMIGDKEEKIKTLESLTGGLVYTKNGWAKLSEAAKETDVNKQVLKFDEACAKLSIPKEQVQAGGNRWTDKYTKTQKTVAGIVAGTSGIALGAGAFAAWKSTRPSDQSSVKTPSPKPAPGPRDQAF